MAAPPLRRGMFPRYALVAVITGTGGARDVGSPAMAAQRAKLPIRRVSHQSVSRCRPPRVEVAGGDRGCCRPRVPRLRG